MIFVTRNVYLYVLKTIVLPKKVSLDTKASELKVILNGCPASKIKVSLDATRNKK